MNENMNYGDVFINNSENNNEQNQDKSITISTPKAIGCIAIGWLGLSVVATIIVLVIQAILGDTSGLLEEELVKLNGYVNLASYAIIFISLLLLLGLPIIKKLINQFKDIEKIGKGLMYGGILLGSSIAYNLIVMLIYPDFGGSNDNQTQVVSMITTMPISSFLMVVILAPLTEEITYRLGLVSIFKKKNKIFALIISSIIFGLIHFNPLSEDMITELIALPSYIISGAVLGLAYLNEDSLATSVTAHLTNNLIAFVQSFIPVETIINKIL